MSSIAKRCKECRIEKPFDQFSVIRKQNGRVHLYPYCLDCAREKSKREYWNNIPRHRENKAKNYAKNRERDCAYARTYRSTHKEKNAEINKSWKTANRAKVTAAQNARYKLNRIATPPWLSFIDKLRIAELYELAHAKTMQTGIKQHVDHIFPLRGKGFCGLNVPWNLQIVDASVNVRKHANVSPEFANSLWGR